MDVFQPLIAIRHDWYQSIWTNKWKNISKYEDIFWPQTEEEGFLEQQSQK